MSGDGSRPGRSDGPPTEQRDEFHPDDDDHDMGDLFAQLEDLEESVDTHAEREQVRETMRMAMSVSTGGVFGRVIHGFDFEDLSEAFLGSLLFGVPMAVEDGTIEAGRFVAANPLWLVATVLATIGTVWGVLYVAEFQDVRVTHRLFGLVPRRPVGVLLAAFTTALFLFTAWGRVAWTPADPAANVEPLAVCLVATFPMAIGGALGDILPGS